MAFGRILTIVVGLGCLILTRITTAVSDKVPNNNNNKINKHIILGGKTSRFVVGGATVAPPQQPQQEDAWIYNFNHPDNNSKNNNENGVDSDDDAIFVRKCDGRLEALDGSKVRFWVRVVAFFLGRLETIPTGTQSGSKEETRLYKGYLRWKGSLFLIVEFFWD
jgi:hypothetical protein